MKKGPEKPKTDNFEVKGQHKPVQALHHQEKESKPIKSAKVEQPKKEKPAIQKKEKEIHPVKTIKKEKTEPEKQEKMKPNPKREKTDVHMKKEEDAEKKVKVEQTQDEKKKKKIEGALLDKLNQEIKSEVVSQKEPDFLEKMFMELKGYKQAEKIQEILKNTVYKGFKTIPIQKLEPRQKNPPPPTQGKELWKKDLVIKVFQYYQSCPLSYKHYNGFFKAFYDAYTLHGDIKITPDDVWMTIMLFFTKYVDKNSAQLRKAFVHHPGQMELVIQTKNASLTNADNNWNQFFQKIIVALREKTVKGVIENLECNFTSTDKFSSYLSTIMIMNTYKKYFPYTMAGGICGIQNIHMAGDLEDWLNLQKKLIFLRDFDVDGNLKMYVDKLAPVLDQFTETYKGNAHVYFWNNIYNERPPDPKIYGGFTRFNGWLLRFFTFKDELEEKVNIEEISVPVKVVNINTKEVSHVHIVGGCRGVSVEDKNVYRPHFSYAVVEKKKLQKKK